MKKNIPPPLFRGLVALLLGVAVADVIVFFITLKPEQSPAAFQTETQIAVEGALDVAERDSIPQMQLRPEAMQTRSFDSVFPTLAHAPVDWRRFKPTALTVAPLADAPITFNLAEYKEEDGRVSWTGRNEDMPLAAFVFSANAGAWAGVMILPDGVEYNMHGLPDGTVAVRKAAVPPDGAACGVTRSPMQAAALVAASGGPGTRAGEPLMEADTQPLPAEPPLDVADINGYYYPTLLLVVDKPFVDALGLPANATQDQKQGQVDAICAACVAAMNIILVNSQISNMRWQFAGALIAPDDFVHVSVFDSLDELDANTGKMGILARKEASRIGADQILFIAGSYVAGDVAGVAISPVDPVSGLTDYFAPYAVAYDVFGIYTKCHEAGHNFGLMHDRITDNVLNDNDGKYYYGHTWNLVNQANMQTVVCGDIMAYAMRVPYYSNPQITLANAEIGAGAYQFPAGETTIGIPAGQPRAADAARWLREKAQSVASYRRPLVFLYNPSSMTAAPNTQATFTALATVGRTDLCNKDKITYQWYFNSTPITSATTSTYIINSVTASDAGTYALCATSMGDVTIYSTPAILTVSSGLPSITSQPQSTTVAKGATFTLSAAVSGYNISFQWRKDGVVIHGVSSPAYTKANAADNDAGSYTLTVSNENGSVTSDAATVTVTSNNGGGGGNGGGVPSIWYIVALVFLLVRNYSKKRKI